MRGILNSPEAAGCFAGGRGSDCCGLAVVVPPTAACAGSSAGVVAEACESRIESEIARLVLSE